MLKNYGERPVDSQGHVSWALDAPCTSFQLLRVVGNRGGYPLLVKCNPDSAAEEKVTVTGPHVEAAGEGREFSSVRIEGAEPGDVYELHAGQYVTDRRLYHARSSIDGYTATRRAPPVVLFTHEYNGEWGAQLEGRVYINPANRLTVDLSAQRTVDGLHYSLNSEADQPLAAHWDLSRFTGLRFVVETNVAWTADNMRPFVELMSQAGPRTTEDIHGYGPHLWTELDVCERLYVGDFGTLGGLLYGVLQLGAASEVSAGGRTLTAAWSPHVRFGVHTTAGTFPRSDAFTSNGGLLRLTVVAW